MTRVGWAIVITIVVLAGAIVAFGESVTLNDSAIYLVQVTSGNWSPELGKNQSIPNWYFLFGVVTAVVINLGTLAGLGGLFRKVSQLEEKAEMRTSQAFALKDAQIKAEILNALQPEQFEALRPVIEQAFRRGEENWRAILEKRSPARAKRFFESLEKNEL